MLSGSTKGWNGKVSMVYVPAGWEVTAHYQRWHKKNDWVLDEERQGHFKLAPGINNLKRDRYALYHDSQLEHYFRDMLQDEHSADKIQGLMISKATSGEALVLYEHEVLTESATLTITLQ